MKVTISAGVSDLAVAAEVLRESHGRLVTVLAGTEYDRDRIADRDGLDTSEIYAEHQRRRWALHRVIAALEAR